MAKNPRLIDISGQRFGRWTVVHQQGNLPGGGALWRCQCDCGTVGVALGADLRRGKSKSCGCLCRETSRAKLTTHGSTGTRLHRIWKAMRARCSDSKNPWYGGLGITVCEEWNDFRSFQAWAIESGYKDDLSIDRIEGERGYSPDNCAWATDTEQSVNRRMVLRNDLGQPWCEIAKANGIRIALMHSRIHEGWPIEKAATLPKGTRLASVSW